MKKKNLLTTCLLAGAAISSQAATLDFESLTVGPVVGQVSSGQPWAVQYGDTDQYAVAAYDGGQALAVSSSAGGGINWIPLTEADLGFAFDDSSSVVRFSLDVARDSAGNPDAALKIRLVNVFAGDEIVAFEFKDMGDHVNTQYNSRTDNVGGTANTIVAEVLNFGMPTGTSGYINLAAVIDFEANQVTSVTYGGVEQLAAPLDLGLVADNSTTLGIYMPNGASDPVNTIYFDNIVIADASAGGLIASESFDYPAGETLADKGSADDAGWGSAWYGINPQNWDINAGSLDAGDYPVISTSGGHIQGAGTRAFRDFDKVYSGETDETVYMSFLRKESEYFEDIYLAFELFNGGTNDGANRVFQLGALSNDSAGLDDVPYKYRISARSNNVKDTLQHLGDRDQNAGVEFYVLKIELKAADADVISIWRNPGAVLGEPDAVVQDLPEFPFSFDRVAFASWTPSGSDYTSLYDEFRIGGSLEDVMAVSGGQTWNGYAVDANGWVDTGDWMGMVWVTQDPWVYSLDLGKYVYVPDGSGWVFIP